jgi:YHS domain-containing protein
MIVGKEKRTNEWFPTGPTYYFSRKDARESFDEVTRFFDWNLNTYKIQKFEAK